MDASRRQGGVNEEDSTVRIRQEDRGVYYGSSLSGFSAFDDTGSIDGEIETSRFCARAKALG